MGREQDRRYLLEEKKRKQLAYLYLGLAFLFLIVLLITLPQIYKYEDGIAMCNQFYQNELRDKGIYPDGFLGYEKLDNGTVVYKRYVFNSSNIT